LDVVGAHQALDVVAADILARAQQRLPHPPVAVGAVVGLVRSRMTSMRRSSSMARAERSPPRRW
jgi:hypothetical protein